MLPGLSGLEVCKQVRQKSDVPIIMLTARSEEVDKLLGLELGADDYITKPFSLRELVARIKVVLRRSKGQETSRQEEVTIGDLYINFTTREVRIHQREIELTPTEFALLSVMARHPGRVFTFAAEAASRDIDFQVKVDQHLPLISLDPDRITQVLLNLLSNALRHTPPGGLIRLLVEEEKDHLHVRITDTGPGIDPEDLPYIFERFYRSRASRPQGEGGMGLGLAIAKEIVVAHGGRIWTESVPGQGSTFHFVIPL